jgi:hypothetical protein
MRNFYSSLFISFLVILSFNSCKVSFTGPLKANLEKQKLELGKIQYYNSKTITLRRVVSSKETEVLSGTVTMQNGQMIEEIEIKKNTPGVLVKASETQMQIKFEPGNQKENYLVFELSPNFGKQFTLQNIKGKVNYHGAIYRTTLTQPYPELLIKKKSSRATTYNKRKAKGVKID